MTEYWKPCPNRTDAAGRPLDQAGKLIKQPARKDLEATDGVDPKREVKFTQP